MPGRALSEHIHNDPGGGRPSANDIGRGQRYVSENEGLGSSRLRDSKTIASALEGQQVSINWTWAVIFNLISTSCGRHDHMI